MTTAEWVSFLQRSEIPAFNAKILENPEDDLRRLVFADWVEENCPNREFVHSMRRSIAAPEVPEWCHNFSLIYGGHELRLWRGRIELGIDFTDAEYEPFPDAFVRVAWASGWVGRLKLRSTKPLDRIELFADEMMCGIEWINMDSFPITTSALRCLTESPSVSNRRGFEMRINDVNAELATLIARAPSFTKLRTLSLGQGNFSGGARRILVASRKLPEAIRAQFQPKKR